MHDIISVLLQPRLQRIRVNDFNIAESAFFNLRSRHVDETRLSFDADDSALRANTLGQQVHDPNWPATDVNGLGALLNSHAIEHRCCLLLEATCLGHEPLLFCKSAAKGIGNGEGWHASSPLSCRRETRSFDSFMDCCTRWLGTPANEKRRPLRWGKLSRSTHEAHPHPFADRDGASTAAVLGSSNPIGTTEVPRIT